MTSTDERHAEPWQPRTWIAVVLSLIAPSAGIVYAGRFWLAALALSLWIAPAFAVALLVGNGAVSSWLGFGLLVPAFVLIAVGSALAARRATPARRRASQQPAAVATYIIAVVATLFGVQSLIRSQLVESFTAASTSMLPSLVRGQSFTVSKLRPPIRGDIVVYSVHVERFPGGPARQSYLKRVVALGGDHFRIDDAGTVWINGESLDGAPCGAVPNIQPTMERPVPGHCVEERFGARSWRVWRADDRDRWRGLDIPYLDITVPSGHFFVLGDNREASEDSRFRGPVPDADLLGVVIDTW